MEKQLKMLDDDALLVITEKAYDDMDKNLYAPTWDQLLKTYGPDEGPAYEFSKMVNQVIFTLEQEGYSITKVSDKGSEYYN